MTTSPPDLALISSQFQAVAWDDEAFFQSDMAVFASWLRRRAIAWSQPKSWAGTYGGDPLMAAILLSGATGISCALVARRQKLAVKR
jgi:hypothetical protein